MLPFSCSSVPQNHHTEWPALMCSLTTTFLIASCPFQYACLSHRCKLTLLNSQPLHTWLLPGTVVMLGVLIASIHTRKYFQTRGKCTSHREMQLMTTSIIKLLRKKKKAVTKISRKHCLISMCCVHVRYSMYAKTDGHGMINYKE